MFRTALSTGRWALSAVLMVCCGAPSQAQQLGTVGPVITSVSPIAPQAAQNVVIGGSGFGVQPAYDGDSPFIMVSNLTRNWRAGCRARPECGSGDNRVTLRVTEWSDREIRIEGFTGRIAPRGPNVLNAGDKAEVWVWNAQTGAGPATYLLTVGSGTSPVGGIEERSVSVPANRSWTATGIELHQGDEITISASGVIRTNLNGATASPAGTPPNCSVAGPVRVPFTAPQLPCWSLVGRVGRTGRVFEVGTRTSFRAATTGELYLGVNDNVFNDNSGSWNASVTVGQSGHNSTPVQPASGGATVIVPGNQPWTATGVNLKPDELFTVTASGGVSFSAGSPPVGPGGELPDCLTVFNGPYGWRAHAFLANNLPCDSLLGRIGEKGTIFEIGTGMTFRAKGSGQLYLGVNDNVFGDNSGNWTATIRTATAGTGSVGGQSASSQPQSTSGLQPRNSSDQAILSDINARLWEDSVLKTLDIRVSSQDGIVTLTGTVQTALQKAAVERIAQDEKGVRQVIDQIVAPGSRGSTSTDGSRPATQGSATNQGATDIRGIDFRNFEYRSDALGHAVRVSNGQWNGPAEGDTAGDYFEVVKVAYGYLTESGQREAAVLTRANPGGVSPNVILGEVFVYSMSPNGPRLLGALWYSDPAKGEGVDWDRVTDLSIGNRNLVINYLDGGSRACADWAVTARFQWNGRRFVRVGLDRKPNKCEAQ